jgi:hypothetical protein
MRVRYSSVASVVSQLHTCHADAEMRVLILPLALSCLMGCSTWEGVHNDPTNHREIVTAAAYGLDACQSRMDELAHANVEMLEHSRQLMLTICSFGYVPSYTCVGTVPYNDSTAPQNLSSE